MNRRDDNPFQEPARRSLGPGVYELEGGVPLGAAIPPGYQPPNEAVPTVQAVEPTNGPWRMAGRFGYRQQFRGPVPPEGSVVPLTENLFLPGPPRIWNIQWFRYSRNVNNEGSANYGNWDVRGRLTYGVGGAQNIIECDVMTGQQLALVANSVKAELIMYNPSAAFNDGDPPPVAYDPGDVGFVGGAMFGLDGAAGQGLPPTYSTPIYQASELGALEVDIAVPDFARSVALHTSVDDVAELALTFLRFSTPNIAEKSVNAQAAYGQLIAERGIALPGHTNQVRLSVGAGSGTIARNFSLQFFLAF